MFVKKLVINNFRNYKNADIELSPSVNLVCGQNGQGKTNLAESIVFASMAKSPRTHQDKELIMCGEDYAEIKILLESKVGKKDLQFNINKQQDNAYYINGTLVKRLGELFGNLVCVYFSPQELKIVTGGPSDRRDFCDDDISMLSESYYNLLARYERVLLQRNRLLKTERDISKIIDTIGVWNEQLASLAAPIIKTRKSFIDKLSPYACEYLHKVSSYKEELSIEYVGIKGETKEELKQNILNQLEESLERDIEVGYTNVGPHRDDIKFSLNNLDARTYASQGQARSIVLAIKLAEMKIMEAELNEKPIMIFDDVFSELDNSRQKKLYECLEDAQVIFTGTNFRFKPECNYKKITVKSGMLKVNEHN